MEIIATVVVQERRVDARVVTCVFEYEVSTIIHVHLPQRRPIPYYNIQDHI